MFSAFGKTAAAVLVIQVVVAFVQALLWAPRAFEAGCNSPNARARKYMRSIAKNPERRAQTVQRMVWANFFTRVWLLADIRMVFLTALHTPGVAWKDRAVSRIRLMAVLEFALAFAGGLAAGGEVWQALGLGAVDGLVLFVFGAMGAYTGRLTATAGDKLILGIQ
jgi:hypothetical protein